MHFTRDTVDSTPMKTAGDLCRALTEDWIEQDADLTRLREAAAAAWLWWDGSTPESFAGPEHQAIMKTLAIAGLKSKPQR